MFTTSAEKIKTYTDKGWWGTRTLDDVFQESRQATPDRLAVLDAPNRSDFTDGQPQRLTYEALGILVDQMAATLLADGLKKDDIICTQLPNIVEGILVFLAAARLGIIVSPIPIQYRDHEINYILGLTKAKALITVDHFKDFSHSSMALNIKGNQPNLQQIYALSAFKKIGFREALKLDFTLHHCLRNWKKTLGKKKH